MDGGATLRNRFLRQNFLGEVDNLQQGVENWVGEEKAKSYAFAFALTMNYGR
jgi:hypothetical protein